MDMNNKYVVRLSDEWKQHGKIIIACDFDDTISPWKFSKEDLKDTIELLKEVQLVGCYLVIFTACSPDRFDYIKGYCNEIGLRIDAINENPIDIPNGYGKYGKIYANIFLDDRAGLEESKAILKEAMYLQRSFNYSQKNYDEIG